jgi:hypothetical protein
MRKECILQSEIRTEAHRSFDCHANISSNIAILGDRVFFLSTFRSFGDCRVFGEEEHWTLTYYESSRNAKINHFSFFLFFSMSLCGLSRNGPLVLV